MMKSYLIQFSWVRGIYKVVRAVDEVAREESAGDDYLVLKTDAPPALGSYYDGDSFYPQVPPATPEEAANLRQAQTVTMRQARLALLAAGKLDLVTDAIAAMPGVAGAAAKIEWEYAATVVRGSQLVAGLATALNLDEAELDQLFDAAAAL